MFKKVLRGNSSLFSDLVSLAVVSLFALVAGGCGGGGGGGGGPTPPSAPTVTATPGNGQAMLAWAAVSGATSYNVYTSPTSPVTTGGTKTNVTASGTTLSGLTNGTPVFVAVTAVSAAGESALSSEACAVPTAAATAGLTLYDPLCGSILDGNKWQTPLFTRGVANGAMVLSTQASNMEANSSRGLVYQTTATVDASGQRVTTIKTDITVPAATAFRTDGAAIRAGVRLAYQPPVTRFNFPGGSLDQLLMQVGLEDTGSGLRVVRSLSHCDNLSCTSQSSTGISYTDEPVGFNGQAPASYDTSYTVSAKLNETTGKFEWTIDDGANLNLSGTADPAAYLASNANWQALAPNPLAGSGFQSGLLRTRFFDSAGGGSSARMTARFDNVWIGLDNAASPTLWDDFSGGGNSGPTELSGAKWTNTPGMSSLALTAGSLVAHAQATTPLNGSPIVGHSLVFINPAAINTIQADFKVSSCNNSLTNFNRFGLNGSFYNDGTPGGTTAPDINQPNSRVGDVNATLSFDCGSNEVRFHVFRFDTNGLGTPLSDFANNIVPKGPAALIGNTHTLRMQWDPTTKKFTFQANGQTPVVVDPQTVNTHILTAAPYVKPANTAFKNLVWSVALSGGNPTPAATANIDLRVNNVFTAP